MDIKIVAKLFKNIGKILSGLWDNILKIFGNIWESKPLTDGIEKNSDSEEEIDPLHSEDSMKFYRSETGMDINDSIPGDEFDAYTEQLENESVTYEDESGEEHIYDQQQVHLWLILLLHTFRNVFPVGIEFG